MAEVGKTKPFNFNKLVEQALLSLKEIDLQIVDPINKCKISHRIYQY